MSSRTPRARPPEPPARPRLARPKLLQSKWTAVSPVDRELHFVLTRIVAPRARGGAIERVELQAVLTGRTRIVERRELEDALRWQRGWR